MGRLKRLFTKLLLAGGRFCSKRLLRFVRHPVLLNIHELVNKPVWPWEPGNVGKNIIDICIRIYEKLCGETNC